jgi:hypothetical protein
VGFQRNGAVDGMGAVGALAFVLHVGARRVILKKDLRAVLTG